MTAAPASTLARDTAWGVVWTFVATTASKVITLASLAVLARLLSPTDFGLMASALVVLTYVETLGDLGTSAALIYWPRDRDDAAQVTFLFNLVTGAAWTLLALAAAPAVGLFFRQPEAAALLEVLSLSFLIKALSNTHDALLRKDLRFRARLLPETGMAAVKAVVAVALATQGAGAWSLVGGQLAGLTARTVLLWWVAPWRPSRHIPRGLVLPMLRYGRGLVAVNILSSLAHHLDLVVVGRMLGAATLGAYQMAYKVPEVAITTVIWITGHVLFPAFSRINLERERLQAAYLASIRYVTVFTLPAATGLFLLAEPIVLTLFGPQWRMSVPMMRALAVYTGLRSIGSSAGDVLKASGRTDFLARLAVIKTVVLVPALLLGARWGAVGVASAMAGTVFLTTLLNLAVAQYTLHLGARELAAAFFPSLPAAGAMVAVVLIVPALGADRVPWLHAVVGSGLGALTYLTVLHLTRPELLAEVRRSFGKVPAPEGG